jgi:hypothetical protein
MMETIVEKPLHEATPQMASPQEEKMPALIPFLSKDSAGKENVHQCPKCGSIRIIVDATICDKGPHSNGSLEVFVDAKPEAMVFKDRMYSALYADICGECGHAELKVKNPRGLYRHYLNSKS